MTGGPVTAPALKKVVGDERRRVEGAEVVVAVVHDLDGRHAGVHGVCGGGPVERRLRCGEGQAEPHRDLALDARAPVVGVGHRRGCRVRAAFVERAGAGMGDLQVALHHRRGAADLAAADGAVSLAPAAR